MILKPDRETKHLCGYLGFYIDSQFMRSSEGIKEKLPIKNDEESSLVDKRFEISNLDLIRDMIRFVILDTNQGSVLNE